MQKVTVTHKITKTDIFVSVGRGLLMAAAIIGATYYLGSWYFADRDPDAIYQSSDDSVAPRMEHATAPPATEETTQ